jgi:U3 small nucleolar RNA-associated protein 3
MVEALVTYATTLAFYIHLSTLPESSRPDLSTHPILPRLLQLKEGVAMLEDLDFDAASESEGDHIELYDGEESDEEEVDEEDEELKALIESKKDLMVRMKVAANKRGGGDEDEDELEEDDDDLEGFAKSDDDLWGMEGLDDGELEALLADAEDGDEEMDEIPKKVKKTGKKGKKVLKTVETPKDEVTKKDEKKSKKKRDLTATSAPSYSTLTETAFIPSKSRTKKSAADLEDIDALGDPTTLLEADSVDKETRKRSLKFHTSKIAATSARRTAARAQRLGGDEDLPYRDRKAGRDAALRKNGPKGDEGEDLEDIAPGGSFAAKKRDRGDDELEAVNEAGDVEDDGYYDLVKRRKVEKQAAKEAAHDDAQEAHL